MMMPNTALKASACAPVPYAADAAAAWPFAQVALAVPSAPQLLVTISQMNSNGCVNGR